MNNQDQVPTIAELWKEADGLIRLSIPHLEKLASPDYQVNEERRPFYTNQLASCSERLKYLRQQLLERCKILYGMQPIWSGEYWFVNPPRTASLGLKSHELKNMGSALLFMDWELEQRKKEASGD